jgi:hypothetical protein
MSEKCHNNLYVKPFEICNIKALYNLEYKTGNADLYSINSNASSIFNQNFLNSNTDINSNIRNTTTDNEYIYNYDTTKKDLCYSINPNNTEYNLNCVIANNSPWFTFDKKTKKCSAIPNLDLPPGFKYENNYIYKETNSEDIKYDNNVQKSFCENKWYDWIITPNYHFGNQYLKDSGKYSSDDIYKCYKPCKKGYMPYLSDDGSNLCIEKINALDGIYKNKLDFSPISLINLIGNDNSNSLILYNNLFYEKINKFTTDNNGYVINNTNLNKYVSTNQWSDNSNIYQNIRLENKFKNDSKIKDEINEMYDSLKNTVKNDILNINTFTNTNNLDYNFNKNILTYKHPNFNENDPELLTLIGMGNANMLTDVILIHSYYLAYKFANFINNEIFDINSYIINKSGNIEKIKDEIFINNNICYHIKNNLEITDKNQIKRLANIFYKAINICYDNTTDFSKNLLIYTKNAIDNNKNKLPPEFGDLSATNNLNISVNYYENPVTNEELKLLINNKSLLDKISNYISNNSIVFYAKEDLEYTSCPNGKIRNGKECKTCEEVCGTNNNNCSEECKQLCPDSCLNNSTKKYRCGNKKEQKPPKIKNEDIQTPVEKGFEMPNINYYFKVAIKIFFSLITLYIGYIFYEIYGETIFNIYNWLEMKISYLYYFIKDYIFYNNQYKPDVEYITQVKNNATDKYDKLFRGVKSAVR